MRAISLWQPWATAVALGSKRIETRHWSTNYRGPLAIHAAKRCVKSEMWDIAKQRQWRAALAPFFTNPAADLCWHLALPFGAIVAVCELTSCVPVEALNSNYLDKPQMPAGATHDSQHWCERDMGNYEPGRYGWVLTNIRPLVRPIRYKGRQGFFDVPDELLPEVR